MKRHGRRRKNGAKFIEKKSIHRKSIQSKPMRKKSIRRGFIPILKLNKIVTSTIILTILFNINIYRKYNKKVHTAYATLCEIADSELVYEEEVKNDSAPVFNREKYINLSQLQKDFYAVDKKTGMSNNLFNVDKLINTDVSIQKSLEEPKILIFHTHPHEMYADSNGIEEGVLSAGDLLAETLENTYGIKCLHLRDTSFDTVDGKIQRDGAYERMEGTVKQTLLENPSIEMVIDLHRDGVNENLRLVTNVDGKPCAKIMYFNGLCMKWNNGVLSEINNLQNPYLSTNLALSFQMQLETNSLYPGLARKIYLNAYRYSLHMKDKSMLIELGAQTNTKQEIYNSIEILAKVINNTVTNE